MTDGEKADRDRTGVDDVEFLRFLAGDEVFTTQARERLARIARELRDRRGTEASE